MNASDFKRWAEFFQGAKVTIGTGETIWTIAAAWHEGDTNRNRVQLKRDDVRFGKREGDITTTVNAERVRIAR